MINTKSILAVVVAGVITTASMQLAAADKVAGSGPNPFSDCGIGAALFPTVAWAAVTSNIIWDIGITAITSATASPDTCNGKNVKTAQFIIDNYDNLAEQTAKGHGDHLTAMFEVLGCKKEGHDAITASVRQDMAQIVAKQSYADQALVSKASDYYNVVIAAVAADQTNSCTA